MLEQETTICNKLGLHARAAAKLVALASQFQSNVEISKQDQKVNGKSIMGVMMLAASKGTVVTVYVDGPDEEKAMADILELVAQRFGEEE